jgi:PKD domain
MKKLVIILVSLLVLSLGVGAFGCANETASTPTLTPTPKPSPQTASTPTVTPILYTYNEYEPPQAANVNGEIYPDEEKSQTFLVTDASAVGFVLNWPFDYELSMTLTSPGGRLIDSSVAGTDPDVIYSLDFLQDYATHTETYEINNPEQGNWTTHIRAVKVPQRGEPYSMQVLLKTNLTLSLLLKGMEYKPGEGITIVVDLTRDGKSVSDASVTADIKTPSKLTDTIILQDDGLHGDNEPDDGRYANEYMNTNSRGSYYITVTALGTVNGVEFQRQALAWVVVELYPDLSIDASDISFSDDNPDDEETITITATIHNLGKADTHLASIYFSVGPPYDDDIGKDTIAIPAGGVAQAKITWEAIAGDHDICIDLIASDASDEDDYSNNYACKSIHVNGPVVVADAGGPYIGYEGSPIGFDAGNSTGPAGCTLEYRWDYDSKGSWYVFSPSPPIAVIMWDDEWKGNITVEVSCGKLISRDTTSVNVNNAAPVVEAGANQTVHKGDTVNLSGSFWDLGRKDTHTATIDWGDGTVEAGIVTEAKGFGNITGSHTYKTSGVYTVTLTVMDDDGGVGKDSIQVSVLKSP